MSVFAKRLKNGRSWCDIGLEKMSDAMVALMDNLMIKTLSGSIQKEKDIDENKAKEKPPKHFVEKLTKHVGEATRNNLAYLQDTIRKPIAIALKGLKGF